MPARRLPRLPPRLPPLFPLLSLPFLLTGCPWIPICDEQTLYADADGDGLGNEAAENVACPADGLVDNADDCDDDDTAVTIGDAWYADDDHDFYGDPGLASDPVCPGVDGPYGYVPDASDCDDADEAVHPNADEICDAGDVDEDCSGAADDADANVDSSGFSMFYADSDGDTFGDTDTSVSACDTPDGYVANATDCDDSDAAWNPSAVEACDDPNDYNCDGSVQYADGDEDGAPACEDCNDADAAIHPSAVEVCDGADNNCDSTTDEDTAADAGTWHADADADGFGDETLTWTACDPPTGYVASRGEGFDCDDTNATVYPDAVELCDGVDHDCDAQINEDDSTDAGSWYTDGDSDGYGIGAATITCAAPAGTAAYDGDCDDADPAFNPGAPEADCADPNDYNCDGSTGYVNADGDAFAACEECDDDDPANFPGADERCDSVDNNCDGTIDETSATDALAWYADTDSDGFGDPDTDLQACTAPSGYVSERAEGFDCDDADSSSWPGAPEFCDGVDHDCDTLTYEDDALDVTLWYADADSDSFGDVSTPTAACLQPSRHVSDATDCDDADGNVSPSGVEVCNTLDDDCDGLADDEDSFDPSTGTQYYADADADTHGDPDVSVILCALVAGWVDSGDDCDDSEPSAYSGGLEACDAVDNDCNGETDEPGASGEADWYLDLDGDGYGDSLDSVFQCDPPTGYVSQPSDCDDADGTVNPGAAEINADGVDQDCDGSDSGDYSTLWGGEMVSISAGSFTMGGGTADSAGAYTDHEVTLTHDFWIGRTELTQLEVATWSGSSGTCDECAQALTWDQAAAYANALSSAEGLDPCYLDGGTDLAAAYVGDPYSCPGYRLPTEAEWEYAARAAVDTVYSGSDTIGDVAWWSGNSTSLQPVCTLAPNAWGLCDMSGNLWEWTNDWLWTSYGGYNDGSAQTDPPGPESSVQTTSNGTPARAMRGGDWRNTEALSRVTVRAFYPDHSRGDEVGVRLARTVPAAPDPILAADLLFILPGDLATTGCPSTGADWTGCAMAVEWDGECLGIQADYAVDEWTSLTIAGEAGTSHTFAWCARAHGCSEPVNYCDSCGTPVVVTLPDTFDTDTYCVEPPADATCPDGQSAASSAYATCPA